MKKKESSPAQLDHGWSKAALLAKAQRYAEEMLRNPRDDWQFVLWSTLALELLGRAALANIHPALLAESKDWNNLYYALGFKPNASKFTPKSIDITSVFSRLREVVPAFTIELEGFAVLHMARRNEELHAGGTAFDSLRREAWLPKYYQTCIVLIESIDETLDLLIGPDEAKLANTMVNAFLDSSAKAVMKSIAAHKTIWDNLAAEEARKLSQQASVWATKQDGHRTTCPSCGNDAILMGDPIAAPLRSFEEDLIIVKQEYLPSRFECIACKLKVSGLSQLSACQLGNTYKATFTYVLAEYYKTDDDLSRYEDDNNEP